MFNSLAITKLQKAGFTKDVSIVYDRESKIITGRIIHLKIDHVVIDNKLSDSDECSVAITFGLIDVIVIHKE